MTLTAIFLLLFVLNVGMYWLGRTIVQAAAADGVAAAQSFGMDRSEGENAANDTLSSFKLLEPPSPGANTTHVVRNNRTVKVTVRAQVRSFIFPSFGVIESVAEGPVERFYTPDERGG